MTHDLDVRVRYSHTDCGGVVYHANYLDYFEWGRTEFLREVSDRGASEQVMTYREMEQAGYQLVVVHAELDYLKASRYDDQLRVRTTLASISGVRLEFEYEVSRYVTDELAEFEVVCRGKTTLACLDAASGRPKRLPPWLLSLRA